MTSDALANVRSWGTLGRSSYRPPEIRAKMKLTLDTRPAPNDSMRNAVVSLSLAMACVACGRTTERADSAPGDRGADSVVQNTTLECSGYAELEAIPYTTSADYADERLLIAASGGRVRRDSLSLKLSLRDSRVLEFRDCLKEGDATRNYEFAGVGPLGRGYLLRATYYESYGFVWANDSTGETTFLASEPVFSPDSQHFAIANADLEARYTENLFAIWRVEGPAIREVLSVAPGVAWGAEHPAWDGPSVVRFGRRAMGSDGEEVAVAPGLARLVASVWRAEIPSP